MSLLEHTIGAISKTLNQEAFDAAKDRLANQAKPAGSLGIMEDISARLAAIKGTIDVKLTHKRIVTCAGDHGVTKEG
ncbi:MAG: nicotinate-nucleotide--dimethylbenzimidazole phosphoribosyltransferase, partial [Proteobacteria bacterium]|nr:nicotinate-nucleotide--dimethylbenzimidazole phosphoribosyltransferase [Pseudomonadota bacterium]